MSQGFANSSGAVSDGDKGDITVTASGATWTIDNGVVTFAKMQAISTDVLLGNDGAGTTVQEITCTAAGRALLDDATAGDQRTTLGLGSLATQSGTFSGTSSGTNTGDQNLFQTIAVSGQSDVVADSTTDTLNLAAGSGITITTNAGTDTVTIAASGGGSSGTWTPTLTNSTNIDASTAYEGQYIQVGSVVTCSGRVAIDPTSAAATTRLGISLPVASNFAALSDCCGTSNRNDAGNLAGGAIYADTANDRATLEFYAGSSASSDWYFTFTYQVI